MNKKTLFSSAVNLAAIIILYLVIFTLIKTGVINRYISGVLLLVGINIILAVSLNLTTGCLGQIALGHAGFMSVGAYTAAMLTKTGVLTGVPGFIIAIIAGGLLAAVVGVIIGVPALRLRGDYLAIITLAFGEIIRVIIENLSFVGGAQGLRGIPKYSNFTIVYFVMVISVVLMFTLMRSRHGRAILSIREDDIASEAAGVNNTFYRTLAFSVSAFFAGIAGGLYAHYIGILGAKTFAFAKSVEILVIVVLGGLGSFTGSIVSAGLLTILPEALRGFSNYRMLVYALALIIMMIFKPSGLFGRYEFSLTRFISKITGKYKKNMAVSDKKGGDSL